MKNITVVHLYGSDETTLDVPRCYTVTKNKYSDDVQLSIGSVYNFRGFDPLEDSMLAEWYCDDGKYSLHLHCKDKNRSFRQEISTKEYMNEELNELVKAILSADSAFFDANPGLWTYDIYVYVHSDDPTNKTIEEFSLKDDTDTKVFSFRQGSPDDWFKAGRDPENTFYAPVSIPANLIMKYNPVTRGNSPWAVVNNILYVSDSTSPKTLAAVDLTTNTAVWEFTVDVDFPINYVIAADNQIFVITAKRLYALTNVGASYETQWTKDSNPGVFGVMTFDENNVYFTYSDTVTNYPAEINRIAAVDKGTGAYKFSHTLAKFQSVPRVVTCGGGNLYFVSENKTTMVSNLYALNIGTAAIQWTAPINPAFSPSSYTPVYSDNRVYLDLAPSGSPHSITAFDAGTGGTLWKYTLKNPFSITAYRSGALGVNDNSVFAMDKQGYMFALDKATGTVRWNIFYADTANIAGSTSVYTTSMPAIITSDKIFIENNGKIKVFDAANGNKLNELTFPNLRLAPLVIGSRMLIATDGTRLYALSAAAPQTQKYTVKAGDTLTKIAAQFNTTVQNLVQLNNITNVNNIYVGQVLNVPAAAPTPIPSPTPTPAPAPAPVPMPTPTPTPAPGPTPVPSTTVYTVLAGDTLGAIARKYGVTIDEIVRENNITNPNAIYVGQKLTIPVVHVVAAGESLWAIANKYGVTMSSIIAKNNLTNPNSLYIGQRLIIM